MSERLEGRNGLRRGLPVPSIPRLAPGDTRAIGVLTVDDEEDMRALIRMTLELAAGIDVLGEAVDAAEGARSWRALRPDVLVLDHRLPGTSGLELATWILQEDPDARILLFSASLDEATVAQAAAVGIRSCVSKARLRELPSLVVEHAGPRALVPDATSTDLPSLGSSR